ncbi:DUF1439 domain-containing protein [Utexia brackfieldae]|uniref:DUF1439 domain-containing protein n=1 Tax=Utexia brackfieldae TaxID=3074108 RepID=UPI00370D5B3B
MFNKMLVGGTLLAVSLLMAGCQKVTHYSLSEQLVNHYLQSEIDPHIANLTDPQNIDVVLSFDKLSVDVGRDPAKIVSADGVVKAMLSLPEGKKSVDIDIQFAGKPEFMPVKGAIYLDDVDIKHYQVVAGEDQSYIKYISPDLDYAITQYFKQNPIYILDKSSPIEDLALNTPNKFSVEKGQLLFSWL